jgi:tetratricopeptide (TPR) repeat protein
MILLAATVGLIGIGELRADQRDPRLPDLFVRLKSTESLLEARTIERDIWSIWLVSADAEINRLMDEGITAMNKSDFETAVADFSKIIELDPGFAEGWNRRATVLYLMGQFDASKADVDKVLALEPRHFGALSGLGLINAALEREEDAIAAFERALEVHPNMVNARENIELMRARIKEDTI